MHLWYCKYARPAEFSFNNIGLPSCTAVVTCFGILYNHAFYVSCLWACWVVPFSSIVCDTYLTYNLHIDALLIFC